MANSNIPLQNAAGGGKLPLALGLVAVLIFFVGSGYVSYRNTTFLAEDAKEVAHTHEVITALENVVSVMKDAETGQRGYLITGDEKYLAPFVSAHAGIEGLLASTEGMISDPEELTRLAVVKQHSAAKFAELDETVQLRRTQGFDAARAVVVSDRGKTEMDQIRGAISDLEKSEELLRQKRVAEMQDAYHTAVVSGILTAVLGVALSLIVASLLQRAAEMRRRQDWLRAGQLGLSTAMLGEQKMGQLGESILGFLVRYFGAHAGAFFIRHPTSFRRVATYGVPADSKTPRHFEPGDGLLGRAVIEKTAIQINEVPEGYLAIGSALGQSKPRCLVISSATSDEAVNAVLELGFLHPLNPLSLELLRQVSEAIGVAVKSAAYRENLQELLEETQRQSEELQAQSEELRVSNEELEEQSRALKDSQSRLEQQQAELEQTNAQLEEQTQILETQRNDLSRAKVAVQAKADELEKSGRYKSDFLANMSHELRTPLNSSLILSKLLADNPAGNLSEEQVKHAETIHSSGNDLLALINDILDLSKIEAGHMEVHSEPVPIRRIVGDLQRVFDPVARQKGLTFAVSFADDCPECVHTDRMRFEQILRNLLSNAFKFTDHGQVGLSVSRTPEGSLAFAVRDTGIGIPEEQRQAIFEAFRQADGTISRRYGGTGLGLSISRELARLLGGAIDLQSTPGEGSIFSVVVPEVYQPHFAAAPRVAHQTTAAPKPATEPDRAFAVERAVYVKDDRETLSADARTILLVEDDESFIHILQDLAHELGFQCLIATTAGNALALAKQYLPSAVLLDVGLPDNSGLSVLDRLKQNVHTRHIPVHILSAADYSETAFSMGAAGYMLKPVKRDDIIGALRQIETRFAGGVRRVLIVEDDLVQRESMMKLLGSGTIETVPAGTAAECLEKLQESTFDCMVLDLSLPDTSGYDLLETLSKEDAYSFPPVIVYTGRDLSSDEERKLRQYSKSIIIKGAKSPERLLDEVTLFLHRVVSELPLEQQRMLEKAHARDAVLEGRRILVVEDDVRNVYSLTNILEPRGAVVEIARNGREALEMLERGATDPASRIDLVLMDVMMPEMDGLTATREIRKRPAWKKLPVIMLTAKAMKNDQERCLEAGANDYMAKPLDVEKLLSLVRVWMPRS